MLLQNKITNKIRSLGLMLLHVFENVSLFFFFFFFNAVAEDISWRRDCGVWEWAYSNLMCVVGCHAKIDVVLLQCMSGCCEELVRHSV